MPTETITPLWEEGQTLNLSGVDENAKADLIPRGGYSAYVDEAELTETKAGEPMIVIKYKIENDEDEAINGRTLRQYILFTRDFGQRDLKKTAVALNPELDFTKFDPADVGTYFEGCRCLLKIGQQKRKDNGEMGNNVLEVKAAEGDSFWGR